MKPHVVLQYFGNVYNECAGPVAQPGYGLGGPGIEFRWGRDFSHTSRPALGPTQPPVPWLFPGVKRPGRGADHSPPPSAEVENE
jgi:hypothetical protein